MTTRATTYGDLDGARPLGGRDGEPDPRCEEDELIMHLERDQFVAETSRPVPRAPLGPHATLALWALRLFAVVVSLMVVYTFIRQLH
jgi:hypothetical protein